MVTNNINIVYLILYDKEQIVLSLLFAQTKKIYSFCRFHLKNIILIKSFPVLLALNEIVFCRLHLKKTQI